MSESTSCGWVCLLTELSCMYSTNSSTDAGKPFFPTMSIPASVLICSYSAVTICVCVGVVCMDVMRNSVRDSVVTGFIVKFGCSGDGAFFGIGVLVNISLSLVCFIGGDGSFESLTDSSDSDASLSFSTDLRIFSVVVFVVDRGDLRLCVSLASFLSCVGSRRVVGSPFSSSVQSES